MKYKFPKKIKKNELKYSLDPPDVSDSYPHTGDPCSFHSAFAVQVIDLINSVKQQLESALTNVSTEISGIGNSLKRDVWWIITIGGSIVGIFCVFVAFMAPRIWSTVTMIDKIESRVSAEESRIKTTTDWIDAHKMDSIKLDNRVTNLESCVNEIKHRNSKVTEGGNGW